MQLVRATNVLAVITKLKLSLDDLVLEPDIFHLKPQRSDTDWFKNIIRYTCTVLVTHMSVLRH